MLLRVIASVGAIAVVIAGLFFISNIHPEMTPVSNPTAQNSTYQVPSSTGSYSTPTSSNTKTTNVIQSGNETALSTSPTSTLPAGSAWLATLPLGDYHYTTTGPKKGYVYLCNVATGGGGAQENGPWINEAADTWTPSKKISVEGSVSWPNASINIAVSGNTRTITTNDLPVGATTGIFPIQSTDPAYQYDSNPNSITTQDISVSLPANPTIASSPQCIYGEVGIMTNGVLLLDAFDAEYRDAAAHEILDSCDGHPHQDGMYHYHDLSSCISDIDETNIIGWAFDGFPITGPEVSPGKYLTTADLDECHGITSPIEENGKMIDTYHYVMTQDFPYSVSCFRGKSYEPMPGSNGTMNMSGSNSNAQTSGSGSEQTPPQAAIDACEGSNSGSSCSFTTPNGTVSGTCNTPPNQSSLACIPNQQ